MYNVDIVEQIWRIPAYAHTYSHLVNTVIIAIPLSLSLSLCFTVPSFLLYGLSFFQHSRFQIEMNLIARNGNAYLNKCHSWVQWIYTRIYSWIYELANTTIYVYECTCLCAYIVKVLAHKQRPLIKSNLWTEREKDWGREGGSAGYCSYSLVCCSFCSIFDWCYV